jgi:two-component system response regulator AtoC
LGKFARILVIDDDETIRKTVSTILKENNYRVDTAGNGKEAVEKAERKAFNLALVDIRLPDIEGTKLLAELGRVSPKMIRIIVTGYPALQNAIDSVNKGADAYLIKPVRIEELLRTISKHLEKQQKHENLDEPTVAHFLETRVREIERTEPVSSKTKR